MRKVTKYAKNNLTADSIGIFLFTCLTFLYNTTWTGKCNAEQISTRDLSELSIRELMEIETAITSASRKSQTISNSAAAAFVLSHRGN